MRNFSQSSDVRHLHLRIGDNLQKEARCLVVDCLTHCFQVEQIHLPALDTEPCKCLVEECHRVAKQMVRCDDILSRLNHGEEGIGDSSHAGAEGKYVLSPRQRLHLVFEMHHGRVHHP